MRKQILSGIVWLISFITYRHMASSGILFYQGVLLAVAVVISQIIIDHLNKAESIVIFKDAMLSFFLIYSFVFTVPTTVDRAYSVKMIMNIGSSPEGLTRSDINSFYINDMINKGGIDKRISEQLATGSIVEKENRYFLSRKGLILEKMFMIVRKVFACRDMVDN